MERNHDKLFSRSQVAMMEKLQENDYKGHYDCIHIPDLMHLLRDEMAELEDSFKNGTQEDIRKEAADVMNFAAMIINRIHVERNE